MLLDIQPGFRLSGHIMVMGISDRTKGTGRQANLAVIAQGQLDEYRITGINLDDRLDLAHQASLTGVASLAKMPAYFWFVQGVIPISGRFNTVRLPRSGRSELPDRVRSGPFLPSDRAAF
jgi:hypothetical protein